MSFINSQTANVLGTVSGIVQGVGQFMGARQEIVVGDYNAGVLEQRAQAERASSILQEQLKKKAYQRTIGSQVSLYAKSGVKMTGSALDVIADSMANAHMDMDIDKYNSEVTARGYETEAQMQRYQARQRAQLERAKGGGTLLSEAAKFLLSQLGTKSGTKIDMGGGGPSPFGNIYGRNTPRGVIDMGTFSKLPGK